MDSPRASRALEAALLANFVLHGAAMLSMATLLLPFLPGGSTPDDAMRVARLAQDPWLFRLGWVPWHLCALADLAMAVALVRSRWIPRAPAVLTLLFTLAAIVPDQGSQLLWITRGVDLAKAATRTADLAPYLGFERAVFPYLAGWAALLYTAAGVAWTACFAAAGTWTRTLTRLSVVTWIVFAFAGVAPVLPPALRPPPAAVSAGNAVGFLLLELWFALVTEQVLRRARPEASSGVRAAWRHPHPGLLGRALEIIANSRFLRAFGELLPMVAFRSEITEVIYVNYLVPASRLAPLVPHGLSLQRLGPREDQALFTFLTYRHGHFGPALLGPLRRLLPSPIQSNWRIHVFDPVTDRRGVHFITNAVSMTAHAIGARLLSEGMPMHVLARGEVRRGDDGVVDVELDPGGGSAPDASIHLAPADAELGLTPPFSEAFSTYRDFLAYCVPQDRAMDTQPWRGTVSRQEIALGIPLESCEPLRGTVRSRAAAAIVGDAAPLCFRVARVAFRFEVEELDAHALGP
jgi:hypothetical protein